MTRAVLPNPSARAEWLVAGIIDGALHHWGHVPPLDGGLGDHDHADSETDTATPDDDDDTAALASQSFASVQPSSFQLPASVQVTLSANLSLGAPRHPATLKFENIFEDHGVSWLIINETIALELETHRRCFPAQLVPSASQMYKWRMCAHLLRDLAATGDLPPHSALLSQQLLDLTHRWWIEREDNDVDTVDVHPLAAAVYIHFKLHSARYPDPVPYQFPDLSSLLAHWPTCSQPLLHASPGASSTTLYCCTIVSWSQSTTSLAPTRRQHRSKSSSSASPCGVSSSFSCLSVRSFHWFLPRACSGCSIYC